MIGILEQAYSILLKTFNKRFPLFLLSSVMLFLTSCFDNGVEPITQYNQPYYLYAGNWGLDQVFVIDTENNSVVDTLKGFGSVINVLCTKSG